MTSGDKVWFFYAHLSAINIGQNIPVDAGAVLGKTGYSGNAGSVSPPMNTIAHGAHLHFEAWMLANLGGQSSLGGRFDPLPLFTNITNINDLPH